MSQTIVLKFERSAGHALEIVSVAKHATSLMSGAVEGVHSGLWDIAEFSVSQMDPIDIASRNTRPNMPNPLRNMRSRYKSSTSLLLFAREQHGSI